MSRKVKKQNLLTNPRVILLIMLFVPFLLFVYFYTNYINSQIERVSAQTDTQPPSTPVFPHPIGSPIKTEWSSPKSLVVWWGQSTDNVGVAGYYLYRDGVKVATVPPNEICRPDVENVGTPIVCYNDISLEPNTGYTYSIAAFDAANNVSSPSGGFLTKTPPLGSGYTGNHILGWVYGPNGEVVKAKVTLTDSKRKKQTYYTPYISKNPEYGFHELAPGTYSLLYQAPGLKSQTWTLEVSDNTNTVKLIYLQK